LGSSTVVTPPDYRRSGNNATVSLAANTAQPANWSQPQTAASQPVANAGSTGTQSATYVIQPRMRNASGTAAPPTPTIQPSSPSGQAPASGRVIDIMELPDKGTSSANRVNVDSGFRLVSATSEVGKSPTGAPTVSKTAAPSKSLEFTQLARYGHDATYSSLKGKLEYSEADRRWKLRYIPIDGQADQYGGSVVLNDSTLLQGMNHGDFVEVRGKLLRGASGDWGYAPVYDVAQLKPL
jgi:hypothetical protein